MRERTYAHAIQVKPDFDVALANMANAIKDTVNIFDRFSYPSLIDHFV